MNPTGIALISFLLQRCRLWLVALFVWLLPVATWSQEQVIITDTMSLSPDTLNSLIKETADSAGNAAMVSADSSAVKDKAQQLGIKISKDALPAAVSTRARDSAVLDMQQNVFSLYGAAQANYEDIEIKAGKLTYTQKLNILAAAPLLDTSGKKVSVQEFKQNEEKFTYDTLKYNFQSKRALVRNARSQYGEGFVFSGQVKRNADESIFGYQNLYTTCNLDHPHFGIRANKIKVVPGKLIASGPANLEIQDVPTPLFLPFGMFPIKQGQRSGFILPSYTMEERRGLGLQRGGYYFALSDQLGLIAQMDLFSKGSWALFSTAQYANRYRYTGSLSVNYSFSKIGEVYESDGYTSKDFNVSWSHQMDGKARPGTTFGASVNFGTSNYYALNTTTTANVLNNQYSSSISYSKSWVGKPYAFTAAVRHSQSTQSRLVTIGLPELNFNLGQFSPFQRKVMLGPTRWYEKISASYSVALINQWNFYDSTFSLDNINFSDFNNGIKHNASVQANYNILRYVNWSISLPYTEYWNTKQLFLNYNPNEGKVDSVLNTGFFATRDFSLTSSLSTRIYGMKLFKKGKVAGVRHVLTPSVSATYQPGFAFAPFGYMYQTYLSEEGYPVYLSPYGATPVGGPANAQNNGSIGVSLQNTLQMKVRTQDSSGSKKINLIDGLSVNGSYNLFADSFNMSSVNMSFRTSILNILNVSASVVFDPYVWEGNRRTPRYLLAEGKGLVDFTNGNLALGTSFSGQKKNKKEQEDAEANNDEVRRLMQRGGYDDYYDFNIPWNLSLNAGLGAYRSRRTERADTIIFTPNLTFSGGFNLTERWKVNLSSGLQFRGFSRIEPGYTTLDIVRDLHCWQMSLNLVPFGAYRSFHFTLQVKAGVLQDLKLTRRKAYQDNL